jgi:hypothetical protein
LHDLQRLPSSACACRPFLPDSRGTSLCAACLMLLTVCHCLFICCQCLLLLADTHRFFLKREHDSNVYTQCYFQLLCPASV